MSTAENLLLWRHPEVDITEYYKGATTLKDLTGEFAGFPAYARGLRDARRRPVPGTPDHLVAHLLDPATGDAYDVYKNAAARRLAASMLCTVIIHYPKADTSAIAQVVHETYVGPQQEALARGMHDPYLMNGQIGTAMGGLALLDELDRLPGE